MAKNGGTIVDTAVEKKWDPPFAEPDALGLLGFGISTTFLMFHNVGLIPLDGAILSNAILFGGIAQIIAGIMQFRRNNSFGMLIYIGYGMFWLSFGLLMLLPLFYANDPLYAPSPMAMGFYSLVWAFFTLGATIYVFIHNPICHSIQAVFVLLFFAFIGMTVVDFLKAADQEMAAYILEIVVGIEGIILGIIAFVLGGVMAINGSCSGKWNIPVQFKLIDIKERSERAFRKNQGFIPAKEIEKEGTGEIDLGDEEEVDVTTDEAVGDLDLDFGDELLESIDVNNI